MLLLSLLIAAQSASLSPICWKANATYTQRLDAIENLRGPRTFGNTVLALERARSDFHNNIAPAHVLTVCGIDPNNDDEAVRSRPKLYSAISHVPLPTNPMDAALEKRWLTLMQRGGATLSPQRRKEFLSLQRSLDTITDIYSVATLDYVDSLHQRMAHLLGYESWNDYVDADRNAGNAMRVEKFMRSINVTLKPAVTAQEQELRDAFAASQGRRKRAMQQSDVPYAEELLEKRHGLDESTVRQWFPTAETHAKIFSLLGALFGITIAPANEADTTADSFAVVDSSTRKQLGIIYVNSVQGDVLQQTSWMAPRRAVSIASNAGSTLRHEDIVAFFGAACESLRQLLAATPYETLNESVPADFATAPGQMCESFAWDSTALQQIASENKAGQPLPEELANKIVASRGLYNAYQAWLTAGSWEQLWGRLYADDLFTAFSSGNPLDPAIGARFRATILAPAGSLPPDTEVQNFLGRPISPDAFYKEFTP